MRSRTTNGLRIRCDCDNEMTFGFLGIETVFLVETLVKLLTCIWFSLLTTFNDMDGKSLNSLEHL